MMPSVPYQMGIPMTLGRGFTAPLGASSASSGLRSILGHRGPGGILSSLRGINWSSMLGNTSRALGVVKEAIPIVKEVGPMMNNMRSMLKIASVFKDETDIGQSSNKYSKNNNTAIENSSKNQTEKKVDEESTKQEYISNENNPNFFL